MTDFAVNRHRGYVFIGESVYGNVAVTGLAVYAEGDCDVVITAYISLQLCKACENCIFRVGEYRLEGIKIYVGSEHRHIVVVVSTV